jgi:hypothetical protein
VVIRGKLGDFSPLAVSKPLEDEKEDKCKREILEETKARRENSALPVDPRNPQTVIWNAYQLVGAGASALILTFNKQVKHVANRKGIGELLRCIYAALDGERLCGCLHGVLLHALSLVTSGFCTRFYPCSVCGPFGGNQGH